MELPAATRGADLQLFTVEGDFLAMFPDLTLEGFDETLVADGNIEACPDPFDSMTDDACYAPGAIAEGITLHNQQLGDNVVIATGALGNDNAWVGPNLFGEDAWVVFTIPVNAFGCAIQMPMGAGMIDIEIIGAGGVLGTDSILGSSGQFWGVHSVAEPILEIKFHDVDESGELFEYMYFGIGGAQGSPLVITGPGPGPDNVTDVHAYAPPDTAAVEFVINAYGVDKYGVNVAVADVDGDGYDEILTGPGPGAVFGPQVRGFEADTLPLPGLNFFAYGTNKYGVNVSGGDLDGDGTDEIVTGAGPGAVFGPHVRGFSYDGSAVTPVPGVSYFAYGTPKWGVNACTGDFDGDGMDEIITGAGPGAVYGPHVRGWNVDGGEATPLSSVSFLAYGTNKYGVNVAAGDVDGDGNDEIITGAGPGAVFGPHVRGWNVDGGTATAIAGISFFAFEYTEWGVAVGTGDFDGDGIDEIIAGSGPGTSYEPVINIYSWDGSMLTLIHSFTAYLAEDVTHGVKATIGSFDY